METQSSYDIHDFNHPQLLVLWNSGEEGHMKLRQILPNLPEGFITFQTLYESYQEMKGSIEFEAPLEETETQEAHAIQDSEYEPLREASNEPAYAA